MPDWEYTTAVITHGFMGRHREEVNRSEVEKMLNELGAEGWELSHVFFDLAFQHEKDGHLLVFKRPH
jgi:hypothetical protein